MLKENAAQWLEMAIKYVLLTFVTLFPFIFTTLTTESFDTPKFMVLLIVTGALLVLWILRCIVEGRFTLTRTPIDLPLLLLGAVVLVSTFFSESRYVSLFGNVVSLHGSAISLVTYIVFYLVLVSNLRDIVAVKTLVYLSLASSLVLAIWALLSYTGTHLLSLSLTQNPNFTPTGSNFSTTALVSLLLPLPIVAILRGSRSELNDFSRAEGISQLASVIGVKTLLSVVSAVMIAAVVLTGVTATYVAAAAAVVLILFSTPSELVRKNVVFLVLPIITAVVLAALSFLPAPSLQTPLYERAQSFPRELQLPFDTSWKVSVSAFRDRPFWGTGPGTYLFNFTQYKPVEFNNTDLWNFRFDRAFNEYLGVLATLGAPGLIILLLLSAVFISVAFKALLTDSTTLGASLAASSIVFFIILALHPSTLTLWVMGTIVLASFMAVHKPITETLHVGITAAKNLGDQLKLSFDALPEVLLVVIVIVLGALYYYSGRFLAADMHHRAALEKVQSNDGIAVYNELVSAEQLNPYNDLYRSDLAQTNFALANAIASSKGPTEASPSGSLTDEDRQNIQTLISQAIAEGRNSVALSPNNPLNWEVLGAIYRQISGVADNALAFSLEAYGQAIQKDPLNPNLRLIVGGIYYSAQNYDLAIRFFGDAVNLKPDLANGYYNLSVALKDKGDLKGAVAAAERTVSLLEPTSEDYKAASDFLAELKKQDEEATKKAAETTPPAATTNSALQNQNLPKVVDLQGKPQIATPEAVKREDN